MNTKVAYLRVLIGVLVLLMAAPPWIQAQSSGTGATFRQEELDQMLAPIALYPDALLAQILVAATYPDQVMEADQWVRQNNNLQGDELNAALDGMDWDLSVKALVPFPQVLSMMSDKMDWTRRMGDAFLAQQNDVMDTIQRLRAQAHAQGNLTSTDQQKVVVRGESIAIEPANPRVVYVPTYNPAVIYGPWGHPAYPPYAYNPYYPNYAYDPAYTGVGLVTAGLLGFATGIAVGSFWHSGWGHWDWGRRHVNVNVHRNININRNDLRRRDFRTANWQQVNRQRGALRSDREAVGQSRNNRTSREKALRTGAGSTTGSVNRARQQRETNAQVRQDKQTKARQQRESNVQVRQDKQTRARQQRESNAQVRQGRRSGAGNSRGDSLNDAGSRRRGNKPHGGGGDGSGRGGGSQAGQE